MTERAYTSESEFPPLTKGLPRLYSMRFCPYAHRARLVLNYHQIKHEIININTKDKPTWFVERNPLGAVPTVEVDGRVVYESLIVCEFLDQVYGDDKLLTKHPYCRAQQKMLIERFSKLNLSYWFVMMAKTDEELAENAEKLKVAVQLMEDTLNDDYYGGKAVSMVDLYYWPWFERFPTFKELVPSIDPVPVALYPKLVAWMERMKKQPAVVKASMPLPLLAAFGKCAMTGATMDFNLGLA